VFPQWELSRYPREWARQLDRFDEVWAPTRFVFEALRGAVSRPVIHLPYPVQVNLRVFLGRKYFGLPETGFLFIFVFDFGSHVQRKNPGAVIKAFGMACAKAPHADFHLVIKMSGHNSGPAVKPLVDRFMAEVRGGPYAQRIIIVDNVLTDIEMKNLIRCADCFVSLHRSEGLGRGLAEVPW
jgi:glycosyltransferase involved in cell wall biosynthesis